MSLITDIYAREVLDSRGETQQWKWKFGQNLMDLVGLWFHQELALEL